MGGWKSQYDRNRERPILRNISVTNSQSFEFLVEVGGREEGCVWCVCAGGGWLIVRFFYYQSEIFR